MTGVAGQLSETDGERNRALIQGALDAGTVCVLPGRRIPLAGGLVLADGRTLRGERGTVLVRDTADAVPVVHVLGSRTELRDVGIQLPAATDAGLHDGARFTAVTIGDYLYPARPDWLDGITVRGLRVTRPGQCPANSIAVMGAVRGVTLVDVEIIGGGTGVAVHWGAVARSVSEITGPSFHPYRLVVTGLRVWNAFEGFYLSSVHDVEVSDVTCENVALAFRLLPGDNTDTYHEDPDASQVSRRITVRDVRAAWHGIYAVRVAGWGRSEVDHDVRRLAYRDVTVSSCRFRALPADGKVAGRPRRTLVLEHADGATFDGITIEDGVATVSDASVDGRPVTLSELPSPARLA